MTVNLLHLLQGSSCEHNYDDCLVNPCPEGFSCIDGINDVSCLPPVLLETTVRNISHGLATRDPASAAELSAGICEWNVEKQYQNNILKRIWAFKWLLRVNILSDPKCQMIFWSFNSSTDPPLIPSLNFFMLTYWYGRMVYESTDRSQRVE